MDDFERKVLETCKQLDRDDPERHTSLHVEQIRLAMKPQPSFEDADQAIDRLVRGRYLEAAGGGTLQNQASPIGVRVPW